MSKMFKSVIDSLEDINTDENKVKYLCDIIIKCSEDYYEHNNLLNNSLITNNEFDKLTDKLKELDPKNPILIMTGWGYKVSEKGIKHPYHPIKGISDKRKIVEGDIVNNGNVRYGPKLDGCSVEVYYMNGKFYMAITRGDNNGFGKDVTHTIREKVPAEITGFTGYVRTECVISYTNFQNFPEGYRIRNSATGLIGAQTKRELLKYVDVVPVSVYDANDDVIYHMGSNDFNDYISEFKNIVLV